MIESNRKSRWRSNVIVGAVLIAVLAGPILREVAKGELHLNTDETRHAMSGVFVLDFVRDVPLRAPLQYAFEYYGKYPAVSIGHWPPAFYVVEALFFWVFGIQVWASRLAIAAFAFAGAVFWYLIARRWLSPTLAFMAAIAAACLPAILLYEKATMLEIPTLALSLGAIHYWLRYGETARPRYLYFAGVMAVWGLLTKQTAAFLIPLFAADAMIRYKRGDLLHRRVWLVLAAVIVVAIPWYVVAAVAHPQIGEMAVGSYDGYSFSHVVNVLLYYPLTLPGELGWVLLVGGVSGIALCLVSGGKAHTFLLLWIAACYITLTPLSDKAPRLIMPWLLPFILFDFYFLQRALSRWPHLVPVAAVGVAVALYVPAWSYNRPYVEGCEQAALFIAQQADSDVIFYQGGLNGDFIFYLRKFDPEKRRLVLREKEVAATRFITGMGGADSRWVTRQYLHTPEEVESFLLSMRVEYIVVEDVDFIPELTVTRKALQSDKFQLLRTIPLRTNDIHVAGTNLLIYQPKAVSTAARPHTLDVPMLTLRHDLRLSLGQLAGRPWPPASY